MNRAVARILDAAPPGWSALVLGDPDATPAHRPEVWAALTQALSGMTLRFIAVERDGELIGGAPVVIERRAGLRWLHAMPFLLSGAPLARAGARESVDRAVACGIAELQRELAAVGGEWSLYRPHDAAVDGAALEVISGETRLVDTTLIDFESGIETVWRRLDRDTRYELRRARRRGLRFGEEPEALDEVFALHLAQSRAWPGHRPLPIELSRRLLAPSVSGGAAAARLFTIRDARGILGAALFLDHPREIFAWWSGSRPASREQHAMPFLFWTVVQWACEAGRVRLNLGGSVGLEKLGAFKRSLGARVHRYPVRWLDGRRAGWIGRTLAGIQTRRRRGRFRGDAA